MSHKSLGFLERFRYFVSCRMSGQAEPFNPVIARSYVQDIPAVSEVFDDIQKKSGVTIHPCDYVDLTKYSYLRGCLRILDLIRTASETGVTDEIVAAVLADVYDEVCTQIRDKEKRMERRWRNADGDGK